MLTYVDDCLILAKDDATIDQLMKYLNHGEEKFDFTEDGDIKYYLGVEFERTSNREIKLTQELLIQRIIKVVNFEHDSDRSKSTTAVKPNVSKDENGPSRKHKWHYKLVIGMLNYLEKTTRLDIAFAVHQCARFYKDPKLLHKQAVYQIIRYLIRTKKNALVFQPDNKAGIKYHVDADFLGNWSQFNLENPASVLLRTGFVITYAKCPLVWASKLQTETSLPTTEEKYIALSQSLREIIPLLGLLNEIKRHFSVIMDLSKIKCTVFEDNKSCIQLAKAPRMNLQTKYIVLNTIISDFMHPQE